MAKIILTDGSVEFLSPGAARAKVSAGEAKFPAPDALYSTRQMVAEKPRQLDADIDKVFEEEVKPKRKRRTKAEIEADASAAESDEESV